MVGEWKQEERHEEVLAKYWYPWLANSWTGTQIHRFVYVAVSDCLPAKSISTWPAISHTFSLAFSPLHTWVTPWESWSWLSFKLYILQSYSEGPSDYSWGPSESIACESTPLASPPSPGMVIASIYHSFGTSARSPPCWVPSIWRILLARLRLGHPLILLPQQVISAHWRGKNPHILHDYNNALLWIMPWPLDMSSCN